MKSITYLQPRPCEATITITLSGANLVVRSQEKFELERYALEASTVLRGRGISLMNEAFDDPKKAYDLARYFTQDCNSYRALVSVEQLQNFLLSNYDFYLEKSKTAIGLDSFIAFARNDIFCSYARFALPGPKFIQPKLWTKRYVDLTDEELTDTFETVTCPVFQDHAFPETMAAVELLSMFRRNASGVW